MATVLILGATSDIGSALAKKFASKGFDLQLTARRIDDLKPLQSDLYIRYNISCTLHSFDASLIESHYSFWDKLHPKPTVTLLAFGYLNDNQIAINDQKILLNTIQVNYLGAVSILSIISRSYKNQGSGLIAGISSVAGERGRASNYIYGSAKAGFTAFLSGLRNELYPYGVHVTTVLPGFVHTKMTEKLNIHPFLTSSTEEAAEIIYNALQRKKNIVYVKWSWKWIMLIIRNIPEFFFKKTKI